MDKNLNELESLMKLIKRVCEAADAQLGIWNVFNHITEVMLLIPIQNAAPVQVQAWQIGDLAVHKFIDETGGLDDDCYQVTHVSTLTRFDKAINWEEYQDRINKDTLLSWCHKVQLEHQDLWAQLRAYDSFNYKSIDVDLLTKIRDWCLSVPV